MGREKSIKVNNPYEELQAGIKGYQSHWDDKINEARKGTDKEVLKEAMYVPKKKEIEVEEPKSSKSKKDSKKKNKSKDK